MLRDLEGLSHSHLPQVVGAWSSRLRVRPIQFYRFAAPGFVWFQWTIASLWAIYAVLCGASYFGSDILWRLQVPVDATLVSGIPVYLVAVWIGRDTAERPGALVQRLARRSVITADSNSVDQLKRKLERRSDTFAAWGGCAVGLLIFALTLLDRWEPFAAWLLVLAMEVAAAYVAGTYIGRFVAHGLLGNLLGSLQVGLTIKPGHLDEAAGWRPIGELYLRQALILAIPAIHLSAWVLVIGLLPTAAAGSLVGATAIETARTRASHYEILLLVTIALEVAAFVAPMMWFHTRMGAMKEQLVDFCAEQLLQLQHEALREHTEPTRKEVNERLTQWLKACADVQGMPTWPIPVKSARIFAASNLGLAAPLLRLAIEHLPGAVTQLRIPS